MVLTKTTGLFLFPAIFWLLWAASGYRLEAVSACGAGGLRRGRGGVGRILRAVCAAALPARLSLSVQRECVYGHHAGHVLAWC